MNVGLNLEKHAKAIAEIQDEVAILSVAAAFDDPPVTSPLYATASWMASEGIRNDGIVPLWSAVLPGSKFVVAEGFDHNGAVLEGLFDPDVDQFALTKAMLVLVFDPR